MKVYKLSILILPLFASLLFSCGNSIEEGIIKEMYKIKSQCPMHMANGITMTDVNFHKEEKVLEYTVSIEGVESLSPEIIESMRNAIIEEFKTEKNSLLSNISLNMVLYHGYSFRYIYTDTQDNELCNITITKDDLP